MSKLPSHISENLTENRTMKLNLRRLTCLLSILYISSVAEAKPLEADANVTGIDHISTHNYRLLNEMALFCQASYCKSLVPMSELKLGDKCFTSFCQKKENKDIEIAFISEPVAGTPGAGYIAVDHGRQWIIVVIRGSSSLEDWIADFAFVPIPWKPYAATKSGVKFKCKNCKVHKGFKGTSDLLEKRMCEASSTLHEEYPDYKFIVTGHSLGGAIATLIGADLKMMGMNPLVLSYAGPKVGNENTAVYIDNLFKNSAAIKKLDSGGDITQGDYIRVVHVGDLVPKVPPSEFFWHAGAEYFIDKYDLPHPPSSLVFKGKYKYMPLISDIDNIIRGNFPFAAHNEYFHVVNKCNA